MSLFVPVFCCKALVTFLLLHDLSQQTLPKNSGCGEGKIQFLRQTLDMLLGLGIENFSVTLNNLSFKQSFLPALHCSNHLGFKYIQVMER